MRKLTPSPISNVTKLSNGLAVKPVDLFQFRKKLNDAADKFATLPMRDTDDMQGKIATIGQLLIGLQANAARSDLRNLDIKTPLGLLQIPNGISLDSDTSVVYQSPTGLLEREVHLSDL